MRAWLCILSLLFAGSAQSDAVKDVVIGCQPILSVQKLQCEVEHVYVCIDHDASYVSVRVQDGKPLDVSFTGLDGSIGDAFSLGRHREIRIERVSDDLSAAALRRTGMDAFEARITYSELGKIYGDLPVVGYVQLDGEPIEFDGNLVSPGTRRIEIDFPTPLGKMIAQQDIFLLAEDDVLITGRRSNSFGRENKIEETDVKQLLGPHSDGFLIDQALYECGSSE